MLEIMAEVCLKTRCSAKSHRKAKMKRKKKNGNVVPLHAMKVFRGLEVYLHPS